MKISVITVCKNAERTIENTILSVLNQTYKDIEYIVIDGTSTDKTVEIIEKYKDKIAYFVSEPDSGIYNAMNKGIQAVTGDIVYFLNANDTVYDNSVFEHIIPYFKKDNELKFLFGNVHFVDKNQKDHSVFIYDMFKTIYTFTEYNMCHQVIFYKADVFRDYGLYDESYKIYADYDFNVRLLVVNKLKMKYLNMYIARFELGGLSTTKDKKWLKIGAEEHKKIYRTYFYSKYNYFFFFKKVDRFFMRYFGTPYKFLKRRKAIQVMNDNIFELLNIKLNII